MTHYRILEINFLTYLKTDFRYATTFYMLDFDFLIFAVQKQSSFLEKNMGFGVSI